MPVSPSRSQALSPVLAAENPTTAAGSRRPAR